MPTAVVDHRACKGDREAFDAAIDARLREAGAEIVACAGFMRERSDDDQRTLLAQSTLAHVWQSQGRIEEAETLARAVCQRRRERRHHRRRAHPRGGSLHILNRPRALARSGRHGPANERRGDARGGTT